MYIKKISIRSIRELLLANISFCRKDIVGHTQSCSVGKWPQKTFFAYSALIMSTLKGFTGRFFSFSAQSQNFMGGSTGPDLP